MYRNRINVVCAINYCRAFSLIEILLSIGLGALLLFAFAYFSSAIFYAQTKQRELLNLQQNSHQLLNYMQQHIQHIGYQGTNRQGSNFALFLVNGKSHHLVDAHCLVFFYDVNGDGCVGHRHKTLACQQNGLNRVKDANKEIFGFKLKNQHIYVFDDNRYINCYQSQCQHWATDCESNRWSNISDLSDYRVERLNFSWKIPEVLLQIDLKLRSVKQPDVDYEATAYSYVLNAGE